MQEKQDFQYTNMDFSMYIISHKYLTYLQFLNFNFKLPSLSPWSKIIQNQMSVNIFYVHNLFPGIQAKILEEKNILTVVLIFLYKEN